MASMHPVATEPRHRPRALGFIEIRPFGDWQIKVYGIAPAGQTPRPALIAATLDRARASLPADAFAEGRHGAGFVIAHEANGVCFGLVYWWQGDNELHQRLFAAPPAEPAALEPITHPAAGCVWELAIIDHESRAWLADVLDNPAGPDFGRYLSRELQTEL